MASTKKSFPGLLIVLGILIATAQTSRAQPVPGSLPAHWLDGAEDCETASEPPLQVHAYEPQTFILRESPCVDFEANFVSDGTVSIEGRRFEVPSRFRHRERVLVRYARFDLAHIDIVDPQSGQLLAPLYPLDKARNADARRRYLAPLPEAPEPAGARPSGRIAPLLEQLMADYAASGLPPAYLPRHRVADKEIDA